MTDPLLRMIEIILLWLMRYQSTMLCARSDTREYRNMSVTYYRTRTAYCQVRIRITIQEMEFVLEETSYQESIDTNLRKGTSKSN